MHKMFQVAKREFIATVATKGFILGIVLTPIIILVAVAGIATLLDEAPPRVEGRIAIIDVTGEISSPLSEYLAPQAIAERNGDLEDLALEQMPDPLKQLASATGDKNPAHAALQAVLGQVPKLDVFELDTTTDTEAVKTWLHREEDPAGKLLALVVIHDDALVKTEGEERFGNYDFFVREKLDDRIESEIKGGLRDAIIDARINRQGLDRAELEALTRIGRVQSKTVTDKGEKDTNEALNMMLPAGFMMLLFISVMSGGQYIMTSTIEEKSSRVVEVVLSAVSPMQLMTGKVIGQMFVGFLILALYAGMGIGALLVFALFDVVDPLLLVYLVIFYLIAYFIIASLMAAIGAAVNEVREAQTFMAPLMVVLMLPWILWMPISRAPDSMFAVVTSFIPPLNCFVMLLRMTSTTPPPWWQVWLSILVGIGGVYCALWFAAKVFRIGLLMYGKPPNFKTLIRWVRMA